MVNGVRFLNFGNAATYHFYQWVMKSRLVPVESVIAAGYEAVEKDPFYEMGDTYIPGLLQNAVAERLQEVLDSTLDEWVGGIPGADCIAADEARLLDGDGEFPRGLTRDNLFVPLAVDAARQIDCGVVAQAVLIAAGRWRDFNK